MKNWVGIEGGKVGQDCSKYRSGTHGLNEELGRHRGREGKTGLF